LNASTIQANPFQTIVFTATVGIQGLHDLYAPDCALTGSVIFWDGSTNMGSSAVGAGCQATLSASSLEVGPHAIIAAYSGDGSYLPGTSYPFSLQVSPLATTTTLTAIPNPASTGQTVTFTATISSSFGTPTGFVTFKDGATTLGSSPIAGGVAVFNTSSLATGSHTITAEYNGATGYNISVSLPLLLRVLQYWFLPAIMN
jgi:hypothetical protein